MATTSTTGVGMFGPTTADLRQEYLKNLQGQFSAAQSPYERMGLAIGNIVGTALGVKDPRLETASTVKSIYSAVAMNHPDQTTPEFYRELANTFAAAGLNEQALMSSEKAKEVGFKEREFQLREREVGAREKTAEAAAGFDALNIITKDGRLVRMNKATGKVQVEDKDTGQTRDFDPRKDVLEYKTTEDPLKAMMAMMLMGAMPAKPPSSASPKSSDRKPKPSKPLNPADYTAP